MDALNAPLGVSGSDLDQMKDVMSEKIWAQKMCEHALGDNITVNNTRVIFREIEKINLSSNYHFLPPILKENLKNMISDDKSNV